MNKTSSYKDLEATFLIPESLKAFD